jgi:hypothetical protein
MADPSEDKDFLTVKLEEDRQKMALELSELKEEFNIARRVKASIRENPWTWSIAAVLTGFLISCLPARKKEVYLWVDPFGRKPMRKIPVRKMKPDRAGKDDGLTDKVWSLIKPVLSTYIGREIYELVARPGKDSFERCRKPPVRRGQELSSRDHRC